MRQCGKVKALYFLVAAVHPYLLAHIKLAAFSLAPASPTLGTDKPLQMQISGMHLHLHLLLRLKSISSPRHSKTLVSLPWLLLKMRRQVNNIKVQVLIGQNQILTFSKKKKLTKLLTKSSYQRSEDDWAADWCFLTKGACAPETSAICLLVNQTRRIKLLSEQAL